MNTSTKKILIQHKQKHLQITEKRYLPKRSYVHQLSPVMGTQVSRSGVENMTKVSTMLSIQDNVPWKYDQKIENLILIGIHLI